MNRPIFGTLDGIRGIAALLVLVRHVPLFGGINFQESYLAVDLFFILSGVVIANAYQERLLGDLSPVQFIWMRIVRIYPLYLLGCAIAGLCWLVAGKTEEGNSLVIAVSALLLLPNLSSFKSFPLNGPAWSLFSEMLANVLYGYLVRWLTSKILLVIMSISAMGMVYVLWKNHSLDYGYFTKDILPGLCRVGYSFSAGILIWKIFGKLDFQKYRTIAFARFVPWMTLLVVTLLLTASPHGLKHVVFDLLCVTIVFPVLIFGAMIFNPSHAAAPLFRFLGLISYPIYALHVPLSKWLPVVFRGSDVDLTSHPLWLGIAFVVMLLPLSWVLDKYYDIPVRRVALRLGLSCLQRVRASKLVAVIR